MNIKKFNHKLIMKLRIDGMTIRAIAKQIGCSRGVVEYAIRLNLPKDIKRELCLWKQVS